MGNLKTQSAVVAAVGAACRTWAKALSRRNALMRAWALQGADHAAGTRSASAVEKQAHQQVRAALRSAEDQRLFSDVALGNAENNALVSGSVVGLRAAAEQLHQHQSQHLAAVQACCEAEALYRDVLTGAARDAEAHPYSVRARDLAPGMVILTGSALLPLSGRVSLTGRSEVGLRIMLDGDVTITTDPETWVELAQTTKAR